MSIFDHIGYPDASYYYGTGYSYQEDQDFIELRNASDVWLDALYIKEDLNTAQKMIAFRFLYEVEHAEDVEFIPV